ncbi:MAG: class I SAM-dependent methyltransferase [Bacteroidota bacterium]
MNHSQQRHPSSYRDPAGFIFEEDGVIYRQINHVYRSHYDHFMQSGLYARLLDEGLIVSHEEVPNRTNTEAYKTLKPARIPFISYPYEWCHEQMKDAARLTLEIQQISLTYGMTLKDATPYNIQFIGARPIFIDTLSWEILDSGAPWVAYRQFCEMFLAPLAISQYVGQPVSRSLRAWPDGVPLRTASNSLPLRSRWNLPVSLHIHLHARIAKKSSQQSTPARKQSDTDRKRILQSLQEAVNRLTYRPERSSWTNYYTQLDQREDYLQNKERIIHEWIAEIGPIEQVLDAGSNLGHFSRHMDRSTRVVAVDYDADTVQETYLKAKKQSDQTQIEAVLPLQLDLADLSPDQGLLNQERRSFLKRAHFDLVMGLALIHHLILGKQIPIEKAIQLLSNLSGQWLILEFVPIDDPWSKLLVEGKLGQIHPYDRTSFEKWVSNDFEICTSCQIHPTERWLYKLKKKN